MDTISRICNDPIIDAILAVVRQVNQESRGRVITLCRHMGVPVGVGNMYSMTHDVVCLLLDEIARTIRNCSELVNIPPIDLLNERLRHPLFSGALIMACFIAPVGSSEEQEIRLCSYAKEINTMDSEPYLPNLDFRCFFGEYDRPLHPTMAPNPAMAKVVHDAISSWSFSESTSQRMHWPKLSKKLLPHFSRRDLDSYVNYILADPEEADQGVLEYLWMKYAILLEGPCEVKQRWYTNGLKPRTYYVCGPSLFNISKHTQSMWNALCDSLVVTSRRNRVNPNRIHTRGAHHVLFYDLTSFTSNCAVQREFLAQLALFCDGNDFNYRDSRYGPQVANMGDIIREYARTNIHPEYTDKREPYLLGKHGVAGFLGVYGNIATCTFVHGAVLLQLASDDTECGCAGDDAAIVVHSEDDDTVYACISLLGIFAPEKTFSTADPDVIYLKRKTWIGPACRLQQGRYIQFPSLLPFLPREDLRKYREHQYTKRQLYESACTSLMATFRTSVGLLTEEVGSIREALRVYYDLLRLPHEGNVPQFSSSSRWFATVFVPNLEYLGQRDFIRGTIVTAYPGWAEVPVRDTVTNPGPLMMTEGSVFLVERQPAVRLLLATRVLEEVHRRSVVVEGDYGLQRLLDEYELNIPNTVIVRVMEDLMNEEDTDYPTIIGERLDPLIWCCDTRSEDSDRDSVCDTTLRAEECSTTNSFI